MRKLLYLPLLLMSCSAASAQTINSDSLDRYINRAIDDGYFPGAQIVIGNSKGVIYENEYGYLDYSRRAKVTPETLYDMASCTKIFATTLSVMHLFDQGELSLDTTIGKALNLNDTLPCRSVRIKELLYHTSGFNPVVFIGANLTRPTDENVSLLSRKRSKTNPYLYDKNYYAAKDIKYDSIYVATTPAADRIKIADKLYIAESYLPHLDSLILTAYKPAKRGVHIYSDLNFYLLQKIIEKYSRMSLDEYTQNIYAKMNLTGMGFKPLEWSNIERIAPTEYDALFRRDTIRGIVHDDLAAVQRGVCGNAGLFGTARAAAQLCGMMLRNGRTYDNTQIIDSTTLCRFTKIVHSPIPRSKSVYALGFTKIDSKDRPYSPESFGHSGYTGTYFWIDPQRDLYMVILTNRVHPTRANKKFGPAYRSTIWQLLIDSLEEEEAE